MFLESFSYRPERGWSEAAFPPASGKNTLIIAFGAPGLIDHPTPFDELRRAYPEANFLGCSTAGEIDGAEVNDDTLVVAVASFADTALKTISAPIASASESRRTGEALAAQLAADGLRAVFVLSDGLHVNGSELVKGLNGGLPPGTVVTGGLAGDGDRFQRTWVIKDGRPATHAVTAVGFYGSRLRVTHGSRGGWDTFGPERHVTRSEGNVLYELDGKPALALYKEYLGERAAGLPATGLLFPLAIREQEGDHKQIVRTILAVDETRQSMTFAGDIPEGCLAQLMKANFDRLVGGAHDAALLAQGGDRATGPVLALAISCVGRRLVLGERIEEETEATLENLPPGTRQVGFYSYGEISPYTSGSCELHNQTMTLTTYAED